MPALSEISLKLHTTGNNDGEKVHLLKNFLDINGELRGEGGRIKKPVALALMTMLGHNVYAQTVTARGNSFSAGNVVDNNFNTAWIGNGMGAWIQADLGSNINICDVNIAWYLGNILNYNFIISVSSDGSPFKNVFSGKSSGTTLSFEKYTVAGDTTGRYVRITVYDNSFNNFAGITELSIDESIYLSGYLFVDAMSSVLSSL